VSNKKILHFIIEIMLNKAYNHSNSNIFNMDIKKAKLLLSKIQSNIIVNRIDKKELNENIHELMILGKEVFVFNLKSEDDIEVNLPILLLRLIHSNHINHKNNYTNEDFFDLIKTYHVESMIGKVFAANNNNLLGTCISYDNFDLFKSLLDSQQKQFNINHQNNKGNTILHLCQNLSDKNSKKYIKKILDLENFNVNLINKDYQTAYESFSPIKKNYFMELCIHQEKDYLNNSLNQYNIQPRRAKI
jgi:hypothetical protein